jgi:hypothetical protein
MSIRIAGHRGRDLSPGPREYEAGELTIRPRRWVACVEDDRLETCAPRVLFWMQLIVMKYFEDRRLE